MYSNVLVMEADFITNRIDRGVPIDTLDLTSFLTGAIPLQLIQLLNFFIVTDTSRNSFRYIKSRDPDIDTTMVFRMEDLPKHLQMIAEKSMI